MFNLDKVKMSVERGVSEKYYKREEEWMKQFPLGHSWTVTLKYEERKFTFPFFTGGGIKYEEIDKKLVLGNLQMDCYAVEDYHDVQDFADAFGYDDMKKAKKIYQDCLRIRKRMEKLLGEDFDSFMECEF